MHAVYLHQPCSSLPSHPAAGTGNVQVVEDFPHLILYQICLEHTSG